MAKESKQGFKESFEKLQGIIEKLENEVEDHSLEEMMKHYQDATELIKKCKTMLEETELKIERITREESY